MESHSFRITSSQTVSRGFESAPSKNLFPDYLALYWNFVKDFKVKKRNYSYLKSTLLSFLCAENKLSLLFFESKAKRVLSEKLTLFMPCKLIFLKMMDIDVILILLTIHHTKMKITQFVVGVIHIPCHLLLY